jgi:hypothetical protein
MSDAQLGADQAGPAPLPEEQRARLVAH